MDDLDDLIDCDKELKLNDPLLSFPLFDTPPSSSHSSSVPSSPSSMSSTTTSSSPASKRSKRSCVKESMFELSFGSDDDFDSGNDESQSRRKKNKYHSSTSTSSHSSIECTSSNNRNERTSDVALNLKDPMMSTSHSPSHFSNDLSYMDSMFFSSQYLSPSLSADDSIDLCAILKTEYDHDTEIMIG